MRMAPAADHDKLLAELAAPVPEGDAVPEVPDALPEAAGAELPPVVVTPDPPVPDGALLDKEAPLSRAQTMEPTATVLVDNRLGVVKVNGSGPVPVPFAFWKGVQVRLFTSAPDAAVRKRVETAAREGSVNGESRGTVRVVLVSPLPAPP